MLEQFKILTDGLIGNIEIGGNLFGAQRTAFLECFEYLVMSFCC